MSGSLMRRSCWRSSTRRLTMASGANSSTAAKIRKTIHSVIPVKFSGL